MSNHTHHEYQLWITRPASDGDRMAKLARDYGMVPWSMPVLDIFWLMPDKAALRALTTTAVIIVTSRHAITGLEKAMIALPTNVQWFAIGNATAEALRERGINAAIPKQTDSEGLLLEMKLDRITTQQVVILKGEGGRSVLSSTLERRGIMVTEIPLYRRLCRSVEPGMLNTFLKEPRAILSAASCETLTCAMKATGVVNAKKLIHLPLAVISERVAQFARNKGWRGQIWVAPEKSSLGLIEAAKSVQF